MAGRMRHFGLTITGEALREYEDYYFRFNAMTTENIDWNQWNIEIYKQGIMVMMEAIKNVENENRLC